MSRDSDFWSWYVKVNDELRHELVERGWFGREVTGEYDQADLTPQEAEPSIWETGDDAPQGAGIHQGAEARELYGEAATEIEAPAIEPPQPEHEP